MKLPEDETYEEEYYLLYNQLEKNKFNVGNQLDVRYDVNKPRRVAICEQKQKLINLPFK